MHGKLFILESIYAGIDEAHLYARLDFAAQLPAGDTMVTLHLALRDGERQWETSVWTRYSRRIG